MNVIETPQMPTEAVKIASAVNDKFISLFSVQPIIVRSPGRVNLIGEHTDYNEGFVLPAAIDKAIYTAIQKRDDHHIHLFSAEFNEQYDAELNNLKKSALRWPDYVLGVVDQLLKRGYQLGGFNFIVDGNVPIGAGLSSSAAVECATVFALSELFKLSIPKLEMVKIAQKAEHDFAGVNCGIMDQFASMFGKKDHVIKLDCRSLEYEYFPLNMDGIKILLLDTNVKHSLASSAYNRRRQECEAGVEMIRHFHPSVKNLRDITMAMLDKCVAPKDVLVYRRCKYIIEENIRLVTACRDLMQGNMNAFGQKMFATHEGISKEYEVSCDELDFLVDYVKNEESVLGARMMGGGFGGCTINLVNEEAIPQLVEKISLAYKAEMKNELKAYIAELEDGTSLYHF